MEQAFGDSNGQADFSPSVSHYRERLTPSIFAYLFALFMIASLGIAYAHAYGNTIGWLVFLVLSPIAVFAMTNLSPVIELDQTQLTVGKAHITYAYIGTVHALNDGQTKDASGHAAHRDAYIVLRSWMPASVIVEITDLEDPHPYWHFSTRAPEKIIAIISANK